MRRVRWALHASFLLFGLVFGTWVSRIPAIQNALNLDDARLGLALLNMSVGAIIAMPLTGWAIRTWGNAHVVRVAMALLFLWLPVLAFAPDFLLLCLALLCFGMVFGVVDVSINAYAVAVEANLGRSMMSTLHGLFSVGGLLGAGITVLLAAAGLGVRSHFLLVSAGLVGSTLLIGRGVSPVSAHNGDAPLFVLPPRKVLGLGLFSFCVLLSEGAVADWSGVYLEDVLQASAAVAAGGYAAFSIAIAAMRLRGDVLIERFGAVNVVRAGCLFAAVGMGAALLGNTIPALLIGYASVGAGLAVAFPAALSSAGRTPGLAPGVAIGAVATAGYGGLLTGPPLIGAVSEAVSLRAGLALVCVLCLLGAGLAGTMHRE